MEENTFRFKHFEVRHGESSMKVGVDAVLLGSWAGIEAKKILEVGTGCGVISLVLAQRFPDAIISAIDIDSPSVDEANLNFQFSPWNDRIKAELKMFPDEILSVGKKFDLIVSNPPYFHSGIDSPKTRREKARHQNTLSPFTLIQHASSLLTPNGCLSMIFPFEFYEEVKKEAGLMSLKLYRECFIRDNEKRPEKRVMMEFISDSSEEGKQQSQHLTLFKNGEPTPEYRNLCHDLYLKF
ncbi:MAG: methyltransferase [Muribaculaceae bacterium]|nr:methyltransferase [Muribaculaceae bacterium]